MSHQSQLEKLKYRNWVKGALAYKYLKEGIEGFADDVVQKEHTRILSVVNNTSGTACNRCSLRSLRPKHICKDSTGKFICHWALFNTKKPKCRYAQNSPCPNNICDVILEEILRSHGSKPPAPNWNNTDVHKWYTSPWEIAKCFINAPGYANKTKAADIDASGLLHIFINTKNLHTHLLCNMTRQNIFTKCREGRNKLFHSPAMELEDTKLTECIDDIIAILEDPKEIGATADAQQAVLKLKELKQQNFIITTHNEAEVHRDALAFITKKEIEFKNMIQEATDEINKTKVDAFKTIDNKLQRDLQDALAENSDIKYLKQSVQLLFEIAEKHEGDMRQIKKHLEEIDKDIGELKAVKDLHMEKMKYIEQKQALQDGLVKLYQRYYVKTSLSPLKQQQNDINIDEVYVSPEMVVVEADKQQTGADNSRIRTGQQECRLIHEYCDLFHSNGQENKAIYIVGDVGAGKSSFCKKMIQDWCKAASESPNGSLPSDDSNANGTSGTSGNSKESSSDSDQKNGNSDKEELRKFDFLFYIPLQRISNYCKITDMAHAIYTDENLASSDFVKRVFEQNSERCLFIIDGLDEWSPKQLEEHLSHESYGLPSKQDIRNATVITLSRSSAIGMLNIKSSEIDQKVELKGMCWSSCESLIQKYLAKQVNKKTSSQSLMEKIKQSGLKDLEKSPLLLQQLVWLSYYDHDFGKSVSSIRIYSLLIDIMFGWLESKQKDASGQGEKCRGNTDQNNKLPSCFKDCQRCENNKELLINLARAAFKSLKSNTQKNAFSRFCLKTDKFTEREIASLIEVGILVKENRFDPTHEKTQLSFIHVSYHEFFAAVYASCQFDEQPSDEQTSVLTKIFSKVETAADILQLSNFLKMICRLCPFVITQVSLFISDIVKKDEKLMHARQNTDPFKIHTPIDQIQLLTMSFLSECDTNDTKIHLSDVLIDSTRMPKLESIFPDKVISFNVKFCSNKEIWNWMTQLKNLQYLCMVFSGISHDQIKTVCSFIQEAPLKCISLVSVSCQQLDCDGHSIELSKPDRLQKLMIWKCKIKISDPKHLKTLKLDCTQTLEIDRLATSNLSELHLGLPESLIQTPLLRLRHLGLTFNKNLCSVVHTCNQLHTLTISNANICKNALTVTAEMKNLKRIQLHYVEMSLETWRGFVDNIHTLQQSVQVDTRDFLLGTDTEYLNEKKKFVEMNTRMFKITENKTLRLFTNEEAVYFCFRKIKY